MMTTVLFVAIDLRSDCAEQVTLAGAQAATVLVLGNPWDIEKGNSRIVVDTEGRPICEASGPAMFGIRLEAWSQIESRAKSL